MVEQHEIGIARGSNAGDLLYLARTDKGGWVGPGTPLQHLGRNARARPCNQFAKLGKGLVRIKFGSLTERLGRRKLFRLILDKDWPPTDVVGPNWFGIGTCGSAARR
jgi:hypothetical protein